MAYREIDRSTPNSGNGDNARTWAGKTNENMKELFSRAFKLGDTLVRRWDYDPNDLGFDEYREDDKLEGWAVQGERYVEGIVLDASFTWPADIDDRSKFLKINDTENI